MKAALFTVVIALITRGIGQDYTGGRTCGGHDTHRDDYQALILRRRAGQHHHHHQQQQQQQHQLQNEHVQQVSQNGHLQQDSFPASMFVEFIQTPPQPAVCSTVDGLNTVPSLVHAQKQDVGHLTPGFFGTIFSSLVNTLAKLLRNASAWLNRTLQGTVSTHGREKGTKAGHTAIQDLGVDSHDGGDVDVHRGMGPKSSVGGIPVLVIEGRDAIPAASIAATLSNSFSLSPLGGQLFLGGAAPVSDGQFCTFSIPVPCAFLRNFLAAAVAPLLGNSAIVTAFDTSDDLSTNAS